MWLSHQVHDSLPRPLLQAIPYTIPLEPHEHRRSRSYSSGLPAGTMQSSEPSLAGAVNSFALETAPTRPARYSEAGLGPAKPAFLASRQMVSEPTLSPAALAAGAASPAGAAKGATLRQLQALQGNGSGNRPAGMDSGRPDQGLSLNPQAQPSGRPATPCTDTPTQTAERPVSWGSGSGTDGESTVTPREVSVAFRGFGGR